MVSRTCLKGSRSSFSLGHNTQEVFYWNSLRICKTLCLFQKVVTISLSKKNNNNKQKGILTIILCVQIVVYPVCNVCSFFGHVFQCLKILFHAFLDKLCLIFKLQQVLLQKIQAITHNNNKEYLLCIILLDKSCWDWSSSQEPKTFFLIF